MLSKLEDQILTITWKLKGEAYGVNVFQHVQKLSDKKLAVGVVYANLDRLTKKGLLDSCLGEPTPMRGGMRKTYYKITDQGIKILQQSMLETDRFYQEYSRLTLGSE
ncbi:helix-turn-helix transcriptional regulator [bacterium]|nr:helix-turn-helix transcriptional regulator [bacterium]